MVFKPGDPKPKNSGRAKGTPNKFKLDATQICEMNDFHPIEELIKVAQNTRSEHNKLAASKELAKYTNAQKTETKHSGSIGIGLESLVEELKNLSDDDLKKILKDESE